MKTTRNSILFALVVSGLLSMNAQAQLPAPFAGGVKLQQGGVSAPATGLTMKALPGYSGEVTLNWLQPTASGVLKLTSFAAGVGTVSITTLDLASATDVGSSILGIANGGTGASTANAALNNLLPSQGGNSGKFLQTDGSSTSWKTAVTSVGLSLPAELSVSGSPVTTTGTLSATWANQTGNTVFASPANGSSGTPGFRSLVAADIPNLDAGKITTGILPVARGGTGAGSFTGNAVVVTNAAGTALTTQTLTNGQIMIGSTGSAPVATTLTAGTGVTITNGAGSITISASLSNISNKSRYALSATVYNYTGNAPPAGFVLNGTSVITITVFEAGGFPITATVTNINTVANTFDFILSGFPTAGSSALVSFQN